MGNEAGSDCRCWQRSAGLRTGVGWRQANWQAGGAIQAGGLQCAFVVLRIRKNNEFQAGMATDQLQAGRLEQGAGKRHAPGQQQTQDCPAATSGHVRTGDWHR